MTDTPPTPNLSYQTPQPGAGGGKAIASLICGICSVAFAFVCCCYGAFTFPLGIVAIVLGYMDLKGPKPGMAKTGMILGIVGIALSIIITILIIVLNVAVGPGTGGRPFGR